MYSERTLRSPVITKVILVGSMFFMGACGLVYEYVLSVLGNNLLGTSFEQIFLIIGVMLFAMGIGALVQRNFTRDLLDVFLLLEIFLGLLGGFSAVAIYETFVMWESFQVVLYAFALGVGLCIGMEIPLLIRINHEYSESLRTNLSEILSVDYVGSLAGAFLFTYVLLTRFSLGRIAFLLGLVNAGIGLLSLIYFWPLVRRPLLAGALAVCAVVFLALGYLRADDWMEKAEQRYYADPVIYRETTKYQHIVITRRDNRLNLYLNGNLQFSSLDEAIYHEHLVHTPMLAAVRRERVLILGGGDGLALREVLKYDDVEEVILVDIDPGIVRVARENPALVALNQNSLGDERTRLVRAGGLEDGPETQVHVRSQRRTRQFVDRQYPVARVRVFFLDADLYLRNTQGRFDVVIIDFPDPGRPEIAKLFSLDFYRTLRARLKPGAVISVQSTSPFFARKAFLCIGETLRAAGLRILPYHASVPTFAGDWGWYLAWPGPEPPATLRHRLRRAKFLPESTRHITPALIESSFEFGKNALRSPEKIEVNSRMRPVLFQYYRKSWQGF